MQCDESAREKDRLAQENTKLQDAVRQLGKKNGELEAQVSVETYSYNTPRITRVQCTHIEVILLRTRYLTCEILILISFNVVAAVPSGAAVTAECDEQREGTSHGTDA